jgi:hypothetical protein
MSGRFPPSSDRGVIRESDHGWSRTLESRVRDCPREHEHRYGPSGYIAWHEWAAERSKTHRQRKCACGLWLILMPIRRRSPSNRERAA